MQIGSLRDSVSKPTILVCGLCLVVFGVFLWFRVQDIGQELVHTRTVSYKLMLGEEAVEDLN